MAQKQEKERDVLKEQCGDDAELYAFLCHTLYVDPTQAISKRDLTTLFDEAEKSIEDENQNAALRKHQQALNKAIFEATQNPSETSRYIKIIQNLAPRTARVIEKIKEKAERDGLTERASYLEKEIKNHEFLSKRIEDVLKVASLYYNERLKELVEKEKQAAGERESFEKREKAKKIIKVKSDAEKGIDTEGRATTEGVPSSPHHAHS